MSNNEFKVECYVSGLKSGGGNTFIQNDYEKFLYAEDHRLKC